MSNRLAKLVGTIRQPNVDKIRALSLGICALLDDAHKSGNLTRREMSMALAACQNFVKLNNAYKTKD